MFQEVLFSREALFIPGSPIYPGKPVLSHEALYILGRPIICREVLYHLEASGNTSHQHLTYKRIKGMELQ